MTLISPVGKNTSWMGRSAVVLAGGLPFLCYLLSASAYGYWFDGGEFTAAAINLGISHPPGQPLTCLVGRLFAMLPLGPLALKIALGSAALAALAAAFLYRAIETTVRSLGVTNTWTVTPLSLGATWFVAGSYGWWFQAVRPEVYSLQAALTCLILERIVALEAHWPTRDLRPLLTAALTGGLALANHHFLALVIIPALIPTVVRIVRGRGWRPAGLSAAACLLGLCTYAYLPLRAATHPYPNLGDPSSLERLFWVVSAHVFQKNTGRGVPQLAGERFADVGVLLVDNFHFLLPLALLGLYLLLRTPGARRLGMVWGLTLFMTLIARAWLGFIRSNPDALGYLMPAFAAVGALFAACIAALVAPRNGARSTAGAFVSASVALAAALLGLAQLYHTRPKATLAQFRAIDEMDALSRYALPPRALLLAYAPQTIFALWGAESEDQARPDLVIVPMPFISYPGMMESLEGTAKESRDLLRGYLRTQQLQQVEIESLAAIRPVFVEMDPRVSPELYQSLAPAGLFFETLAGGATPTDERIGARRQQELFTRLYARLGEQSEEPATRESLLWHHFNDALYYLGYGDRKAARIALDFAKKIQPRAEPLTAMEKALEQAPLKGPIRVDPFRKAVTD
jgi:hypothetical protein